jgi:hypothetical protein
MLHDCQIKPEFEGSALRISAPGMPDLFVPVEEAAYLEEPIIAVQCSGVSTTGGGGWRLGSMEARSAGDEAAAWLTEYLNQPTVDLDAKMKPVQATVALFSKMRCARVRVCVCVCVCA